MHVKKWLVRSLFHSGFQLLYYEGPTSQEYKERKDQLFLKSFQNELRRGEQTLTLVQGSSRSQSSHIAKSLSAA